MCKQNCFCSITNGFVVFEDVSEVRNFFYSEWQAIQYALKNELKCLEEDVTRDDTPEFILELACEAIEPVKINTEV